MIKLRFEREVQSGMRGMRARLRSSNRPTKAGFDSLRDPVTRAPPTEGDRVTGRRAPAPSIQVSLQMEAKSACGAVDTTQTYIVLISSPFRAKIDFHSFAAVPS